MRWWGVGLLPLDVMVVHHRVTPYGTHLYTRVERGGVRVKRLAQEQNTMSLAKAQTQTAHSRCKFTNLETVSLILV